MSMFRKLRGVPLVASIAVGLLLVASGVVMASGSSGPITVCVPAKAGKPIVTPKAGVCKPGYTLTEVGKEGSEGRQGPEGKEGKGPSTIVDRARSVGPVVASARPAREPDPLTESTWTQDAEELEEFAGQVTMTSPAYNACVPPEHQLATGTVEIELDGRPIGSSGDDFGASEPKTTTLTIGFEPANEGQEAGGLGQQWLYEPGKETDRTLTARAWDDCGEGGGHATGHFTADSISVDVIGVK
jgi:hypothetical protein